MKDSGVEWIGEIPEEWHVAKLKTVCNIYGRIGFRGYTVEDLVSKDEGAITLSPTNIVDNKLDLSKCTYISWMKYEESPEIQIDNGDIILVKTASVGKCAIVEDVNTPMTINPQFVVLKKIKANNKYLFYVVLSEVVQNAIKLDSVGGVIKTITQNNINNYKVTLPNMYMQQCIADFLDVKVLDIDSAIERIKLVIEDYKKYKNSLITEAVTKGINHNIQMKQSEVTWNPMIPKHWNVITPKALFVQRKDKAIEGERQLTASQKNGIMYQDEYMEQEGTRVVVVQKDFSILKHVEPDDFVISMRSFQGGLEYSTLSGCISSAYVMLIPNKDKVYPGFYRWFFKSSKYINAIQSTSNLVRDGQAMRYSNFAQVPLFDIPYQEQVEIAEYLDKKIPEIDKLISEKEELIKELENYKKSLIYEYVTGKKEVPVENVR